MIACYHSLVRMLLLLEFARLLLLFLLHAFEVLLSDLTKVDVEVDFAVVIVLHGVQVVFFTQLGQFTLLLLLLVLHQ